MLPAVPKEEHVHSDRDTAACYWKAGIVRLGSRYALKTRSDRTEVPLYRTFRLDIEHGIGFDHCPYCNEPTNSFENVVRSFDDRGDFEEVLRTLTICQVCGWWAVFEEHATFSPPVWEFDYSLAHGALVDLEIDSTATSLVELRRYLTAKFEDRFLVNPYRFEELIASVFANIGYRTLVTPKSGDGGIDIYLFHGPDDQVTGVQVKRARRSIQVDEIRAFVGALLINNVTEGIFVAASEFTSGAKKAANAVGALGMPLRLEGANDILRLLKVASSPSYSSPNDVAAPFHRYWIGELPVPLVGKLRRQGQIP